MKRIGYFTFWQHYNESSAEVFPTAMVVYDEAEELKNELRDELLEYRDCKILAGKLSEMTEGFNYSVREFPENVAPDKSYKRLHEPSELLSAYSLAAGKKLRRLPPSIDSFKAIVTRKIVSVGSKIESIVTSS